MCKLTTSSVQQCSQIRVVNFIFFKGIEIHEDINKCRTDNNEYITVTIQFCENENLAEFFNCKVSLTVDLYLLVATVIYEMKCSTG